MARIVERFLARAEAVAGERGRDYLAERINRIVDQWKLRTTGQVPLGYEKASVGGQKFVGLLERAGESRWGDLTVGQSMRETESEINLLLAGGGQIYNQVYGAPDWSFGSPGAGVPDDEPDDPRGGILIYTAVPDAEGTLGGLVSLAEPTSLIRLTRRALSDARHCSSDPLCAERLPHPLSDFLHGAACHVCLFVSETTCERGNRFLDRRFVVPIGDPTLALFPEPV